MHVRCVNKCTAACWLVFWVAWGPREGGSRPRGMAAASSASASDGEDGAWEDEMPPPPASRGMPYAAADPRSRIKAHNRCARVACLLE